MIDGALIPNADAVRVQEVFRLRGRTSQLSNYLREDRSQLLDCRFDPAISRSISVAYRTTASWYPGTHDAIISDEEWRAAHVGLQRACNRRETCLSSRVRCGICGKRMAVPKTVRVRRSTGVGIGAKVAINPHEARRDFRVRRYWECLCSVPTRISRRPFAGGWRAGPAGTPEGCAGTAGQLRRWTWRASRNDRRALLQLHYNGKISADGFKEEEDRLMRRHSNCADSSAQKASEAKLTE